MLIVGYVFAIRSERRLCSEVQVNLAYRWFCQLGIEDRIPDHSVFSRLSLKAYYETLPLENRSRANRVRAPRPHAGALAFAGASRNNWRASGRPTT
jgi:hypothetical protein